MAGALSETEDASLQGARRRAAPRPRSMNEATDPWGADRALVARILSGEESAFLELVQRYHRGLVRLALTHVPSLAVAEEAVQEAWLGVLSGLAAFEFRCPLKSWIFRIAANCAKLRGTREMRSVPFSALEAEGGEGPSVTPDFFQADDHPRWPGHWNQMPGPWDPDRLVTQETLGKIQEEIRLLPPTQRQVITLRDVEGWTSQEVCEALQISEANQRVLLHRARTRVRRGLARYMAEDLR